MDNYFEKIIKIVYEEWKEVDRRHPQEHPDEEELACFLEDKLALPDKKLMQKHLLSCDLCGEYISAQLKIQPHLSLDVPAPLLEKAKKMVEEGGRENLLEIFIKLKEEYTNPRVVKVVRYLTKIELIPKKSLLKGLVYPTILLGR